MIVALTSDLSSQWVARVSSHLAEQAMVLSAEDAAGAVDILRSVQVSMLITDMDCLTREKLLAYDQMLQVAPDVVCVCLASRDTIEQIRTEELLSPDFWLEPAAAISEVSDVLNAALEKALLVANGRKLQPPTVTPRASSGALNRSPAEADPFQRLMPVLAGCFDIDRLLDTYVQAMAEFTYCANYCLLWRQEDSQVFTVRASQALHPLVAASGRLLPTDCLPMWYSHNCRVLTKSELSQWPDSTVAAGVARELDVFRSQVAIPLMVDGLLSGLFLLGEKAIGEPYSNSELGTLFILSNYVAMQVQSLRLHAELSHSKAYMEHILSGMSSGVITLGPDEHIAMCNRYAAKILQLSQNEVEGADLRCLPSPLGDYLYAAFKSPEASKIGLETPIRNGLVTLRVSTSALLDEDGTTIGSVMLLEDMSTEIALVTEQRRRERLNVLTQLVGHIAHKVKTPLTAITTYAELLEDRHPDEDLAEFWNVTVTPEIDRLDKLIDQLVQMIQQPEPHFQLVSLADIVKDAIKQLPESALEDGPGIDLNTATRLPRIVADPEQAKEAIVYLLRYLQKVDDTLTQVSIKQDKTELGDSVCVIMDKVTSNSCEINPEELFDPFFALQKANGDLGPAISRKIIDNQGGKVDAKMENGCLQLRVIFPITFVNVVHPAGE